MKQTKPCCSPRGSVGGRENSEKKKDTVNVEMHASSCRVLGTKKTHTHTHTSRVKGKI